MKNKVQKLQLKLIERASFNNFEGKKVVADLIEHKDLWRGVVMDRAGYSFREQPSGEVIDLIKLRDIEDDYWNVDTLYILTSGKDDTKLVSLAKSWGADEIDWYDEEKSSDLMGGGDGKILRIWFD